MGCIPATAPCVRLLLGSTVLLARRLEAGWAPLKPAPMKKPAPRPSDLPGRLSDNNKRRLLERPDPRRIGELITKARYVGSSKHKANPHLYGLPPFSGLRGDATLCDAHGGFLPEHMASIPGMLRRGIQAGLLGKGGEIWTVSDAGWIYECRLTNVTQAEYHGYPVRRSEPIAEQVYQRFALWADANGSRTDQAIADQCKALYGFKS